MKKSGPLSTKMILSRVIKIGQFVIIIIIIIIIIFFFFNLPYRHTLNVYSTKHY